MNVKDIFDLRKRYFAIHRPKRKQEAPNGLNNSLNSSNSCSQKKDHESTESTESSCHSSDSCSLNKGQQAVYACIQQNPGYNVPKISADTAIPAKSIERHIKALLERNLITHQGSKKTGGYYAK